MANFYFEENAQQYGTKQARFQKTALVVACLCLFYFAITLESISGSIILLITLVIILFKLPSSFGLFDKLVKVPSDEKWEISLTEHELIWSSPESLIGVLNEISFNCALSDIEKVQRSYSDFDASLPYRFLLKDGQDIRPGMNSSINMDELIQVLEANGVPYERINEFDK